MLTIGSNAHELAARAADNARFDMQTALEEVAKAEKIIRRYAVLCMLGPCVRYQNMCKYWETSPKRTRCTKLSDVEVYEVFLMNTLCTTSFFPDIVYVV